MAFDPTGILALSGGAPGLYNPALSGVNLTPEQKKAMLLRSLVSGMAAGAATPRGTPGSGVVGSAVQAMMGSYDELAQAALRAQIIKQQQEYQQKQEQRATNADIRAQKMLDLNQKQDTRAAQAQTFNQKIAGQQLGMQQQRLNIDRAQAAGAARLRDIQIKAAQMGMDQGQYIKSQWPELQTLMQEMGVPDQKIAAAQMAVMSGSPQSSEIIGSILNPPEISQVEGWPGAHAITSPLGGYSHVFAPPPNPLAGLLGGMPQEGAAPMAGTTPPAQAPVQPPAPQNLEQGMASMEQKQKAEQAASQARTDQVQSIGYIDSWQGRGFMRGGPEAWIDQAPPAELEQEYKKLQEVWPQLSGWRQEFAAKLAAKIQSRLGKPQQ